MSDTKIVSATASPVAAAVFLALAALTASTIDFSATTTVLTLGVVQFAIYLGLAIAAFTLRHRPIATKGHPRWQLIAASAVVLAITAIGVVATFNM